MEDNTKRKNFISYMANPRAFTLKKWILEILQEDYAKYDPIVDRISASLQTDSDLQELGAMIAHVYDKAYRKAISDYKEEAEKLGIKVKITHKPMKSQDSNPTQ